MNSPMNVLKLVEIKSGLKWHIYRGHTLGSDVPGNNEVLQSFSRCLSAGLACCYHAFQIQSLDEARQNATRLLVFTFNQDHIDVASKIDPNLNFIETGEGDDGLTEEIKKYLDLAIQNLVERMLHSDGYITLGAWFARADEASTPLSLYRFNYFNQDSTYWVCASVSVMQAPAHLRLVTRDELDACEELKGRKVLLSPCGVSAQLTGRSFQDDAAGSSEIIPEWKLVYPNMFLSPITPPLLEVMVAGVCMKYPTQFILSYSRENSNIPFKAVACEISHNPVSVRDLIDSVYSMELLQAGVNEFQPWNKSYMRQTSTSSPITDKLPSRANTPSFLALSDRKNSLVLAPNTPLIRMTSLDGVDLTTTPVTGVVDVVAGFGDGKALRGPGTLPPDTLKIHKDESKQEDRANWNFRSDMKSFTTRAKPGPDPTSIWHSYTLPESLTSLEALYSSDACILECGYNGVSSSGGMHAGMLGGFGAGRGGAVGKQAGKAKKPRPRTRSEKGSASKAAATRKKRTSRSDSKKQQTPTGKDDRSTPGQLSLSDREMPPPTSGQITPSVTPVTPNNPQGNGSAFIMPLHEIQTNPDHMDMRPHVLDVLVPTPTALNPPFIMPDPSSFAPNPYSASCLSSSSPSTPQPIQKPSLPLPPTHGSGIKTGFPMPSMPDKIFESEDEDANSMEPSYNPMDPSIPDSEVHKKAALIHKNHSLLGLEESHSGHNFPTPPSAGNNSHSPSHKKFKPHSNEASEEISQITELIPESFKPFLKLKTLFYKFEHRQYLHNPDESPHAVYMPRASLSRDLSQINEATPDNRRGSLFELGLSDSIHPPTPSTLVTQLSKPLSECQSLKKESTESGITSLSIVDRQSSVTVPLDPRAETPEAHALLFNLMLLDPLQTFSDPPPITPYPPPMSAHSSQPNHFTFPNSAFTAQDELSLSLDTLLNFGASRDHSIPTLEFPIDRMTGNFPQSYLPAYSQFLQSHFAPTGFNPISNNSPLNPTNFRPKFLQQSALDPPSYPPNTTQDPLLQRVLELIQRHCLSISAPIAPLAHPWHPPTQPDGVVDLYERQLLTSKLRDCCKFFADNLEDAATMDVETGGESDMKESSPINSASMGGETSQTETGGDTSQGQESDDSQPEDDEAAIIPLDFSLDVDNDGSWLSSMQHSSDKKANKLIRKLQTSLSKSMQRIRAISPLTCHELFQILTPVQTPDTTFSTSRIPTPLPIPTLLVGQEADWVEVAPYDISSWDKLSLSPYASREDISYLVVAPAGEKIENKVQHYFKQLSSVYQDSELGRHKPIPSTKTRTEGVYTFTSTSLTHSYLDPDTISAIKLLFTTVILPELANTSWSEHKHSKNTEDPTSSNQTSYNSTPGSDGEGPPGVVLYVLNIGPAHQQIDIMKMFAEALFESPLDPELTRRLVLSIIPAKEVITQRRMSSQTLRAICLDVFSKCRFFHKPWLPNRGMNFAENCDDWRGMLYLDKDQPTSKSMATVWMFRPPYILAKAVEMIPDPLPPSKKPMPPTPQNDNSLANFQLGGKTANTLFCGYCVSPGSSYLLAVCCDSQGSLLNSAVFGLKYPGKSEIFRMREDALRDLWDYILSIISQTVLSWHVVITRLGRPSNDELRDLNRVVRDLDKVQMELTRSCVSCGCKCNTHIPSVVSVHVLSFLPEKNFRVFLNGDSYPHTYTQGHSVTYILVQPGPNYTDAYAEGNFDPLSAIDTLEDIEFPGQLQSTEDEGNEILLFRDIGFDIMGMAAPDSVDNYHAVGYVLSSASPGPLPNTFWGESTQRNAFFRAQLHAQIYLDQTAKRPGYEESLKKILEQFDALSWLILDPEKEGRVCSLPLHLYTLCNLYHMLRWMSLKPI